MLQRLSSRAVAIALTVALMAGVVGCGEAKELPKGGVALKQGGELAAWAPNSRFVAAPGVGEIRLLGSDGSVAREIPVAGVIPAMWPCECRLGWSGDGDQVQFLTRKGAAGGGSRVGIVSIDGGRPRYAPLGVPAGDAAWSPRGWPLVFVSNAGAYEFNTPHKGPRPDLWRLDSFGGRPHRILAEPGSELRPQFSPDGRKILFLRKWKGDRSVWVVGADGSDPHHVGPRLWLPSAAWSPDGKSVVVSGGTPGSGLGGGLFVASASGGGVRRLPGVDEGASAVAWSRRGWIAYAGSGGTIWRIRPDGRGRERIGRLPEHEVRRLMWSPDGRHLAYAALNLEDQQD